ncbi:hypothetical protein R1sor_004671 [Riccia sorocarpa]|uniref:Uncharacterized protein n=1 Tax=Riccia sorocarpa TaxID=122646 RepID=A0ABD3HHC6_9MARC
MERLELLIGITKIPDTMKNINGNSDKQKQLLAMAELSVTHWTAETKRWLAGALDRRPLPAQPDSCTTSATNGIGIGTIGTRPRWYAPDSAQPFQRR